MKTKERKSHNIQIFPKVEYDEENDFQEIEIIDIRYQNFDEIRIENMEIGEELKFYSVHQYHDINGAKHYLYSEANIKKHPFLLDSSDNPYQGKRYQGDSYIFKRISKKCMNIRKVQ